MPPSAPDATSLLIHSVGRHVQVLSLFVYKYLRIMRVNDTKLSSYSILWFLDSTIVRILKLSGVYFVQNSRVNLTKCKRVISGGINYTFKKKKKKKRKV